MTCYNVNKDTEECVKRWFAMKLKKPVFTAFILCVTAICFVSSSNAESNRKLWNHMCASCHDGKTAPDMEALRVKYQTADAFTVAVRSKGNRCMNILKNDESLIRKIALEIGLK